MNEPLRTARGEHSEQRNQSIRRTLRSLGVNLNPSALVSIDDKILNKIARTLEALAPSYVPPKWDDGHFWNVEDEPTRRVQYLALGNSINFRFWTMEGGTFRKTGGTIDGEYYSGAMYMWRSLRRTHLANTLPLLDAAFLSRITADEFRQMFVDDDGVVPLGNATDERVENLRDLGHNILKWDGSFSNLLEAASQSLVRYTQLASEFRAFDDRIYKLTMVNAIMLSGSGLATFDEAPFPGIDYQLLKQLLRHRVLVPAESLRAKLLHRAELTSKEGYELRRTALEVFARLQSITGWNGQVMDNLWWLNRTNCTDEHPVCMEPTNAHRCPFVHACMQRVELHAPVENTRYY